jgi:hypothetical protein
VNEHIVNKSAVKKIVKVDRNIIKTVSSLYPSTTLKGSRSRLLAPFVYTTANKQLQEQTAYFSTYKPPLVGPPIFLENLGRTLVSKEAGRREPSDSPRA